MEHRRAESVEMRDIGKFRFKMLPLQKRIRRQLHRIRQSEK
jgi:hypothetical protein